MNNNFNNNIVSNSEEQHSITHRTNFIPRGKFDKNIYRDREIDERTQTLNFLGNFKDNFSVVDDKDINSIENSGPYMANYSLAPFPLQYSRQINSPIFDNKNIETNNINHTNNYFKLGDPVFGAHGSNLNAPGSNQHKTPFNELDLLENSVDELFRNVSSDTVNTMIGKVETTHANELNSDYNPKNNMSQPIKSINEYEFKKDQFLERNVKGVKENVFEYIININSADRDCTIYPNPFNYRVEFNPSNVTKNAYIAKYFKNIKYMNLKSVVVPRRYYIINKLTNLIYESPATSKNFVDACTNTIINNPICTYKREQGIITYYGTPFYYYFYVMTISLTTYYICTYSLFLDTNYKQQVDISKLSGLLTSDIDYWLVNNYPTTAATLTNPNIIFSLPSPTVTEYNSWILIANITTPTGGKIKFCKQNDIFGEIIDQTFEFSYDSGNFIVSNTFKYYILLKATLEDDRYLLLTVPEIDTMYEYATDVSLEKAFSILFPDYINGDYYYLDTTNHEKVYDHGTLGNLSKMTISYQNSSGTPLTTSYVNIIDYDITTPNNTCICLYDPNTGERIRNYQCSHSYLRHQAYEKLQNTLILKLGIIEGVQDMQYI